MSPLYIPLEIVESVVGHLHSDFPALKACSLVCKLWVPVCRHHLFRRIYLRPSALPASRTTQFFAQVEKPNSPFSPYVRELSLGNLAAINDHLFMSRLSALRRIETLYLIGTLSSWSWNNPNLQNKAMWLDSLQGVKHVHISISTMAFPHFINFIHHLPALETLSLDRVGWNSDIDTSELSHRPILPRIHTLHLGRKSDAIFPVLASLISRGVILGKIQTLRFDDLEPKHAPAAVSLLEASSSSERHLRISAQDCIHVRDVFRAVQDINLTSIHFGDLVDPSLGPAASFSWVISLISHLASHTINTIVFDFWLLPGNNLEGIEWMKLSEVLNQSKFSGLQKVQFCFQGRKEHCRWIEGKVAQRLLSLGPLLAFRDL